MKYQSLILIIIVFGAAVVAAIYYAAGPALKNGDWDPAGLRQYSSPAISDLTKPPERLKVISYNIGYASGNKNNKAAPLSEQEVRDNLDNMILELQPLNADIIALQEVDLRAQRTFDIDQLQYLARGLNLPYTAYVTTWNKRYVAWPFWPIRAHFGRMVSGQAILSRYPIIDQQTFTFDKPEENPFWYNMFYLDRIAQRVTVQVAEKVAIIWNVHLEAFRQGSRLQQIDKLIDYLNGDSHQNLIVAGDFNSVSNYRKDLSAELQAELKQKQAGIQTFLKETHLRDTSDDAEELTFPSWEPTKKIDFILYKGPRLEKSGAIQGLTASDHLPVWADFKLP